MIRHHFFKEADLGARMAREGCKFHFFDFRFYFLSKMSLTTVTHFRPLDPPARGHFITKPFVLLKEFDVFFSKPLILLRKFDTFRFWLASGAPLGSQGPFWRPSLDFAGRIFGLGSSLGPFLDASGTPSVFFSNFLAPSGIIFSKSLDVTSLLQADGKLEIYF